MEIQELKKNTARSLALADYDPKKLALIHTGVSLAVSLVITLLQFVLDRGIASTGGLSGIGTRSILSTVQMLLSVASLILMPFWTIGFTRTSLNIAAGRSVSPDTLLEGFRRFLPVLRLFLLQLAIYLGLSMICAYVASSLYVLTPYSDEMLRLLEPSMSDPAAMEQMLTDPAVLEQMMPYMTIVYVIAGVLLASLAIPAFYLLRLSQFIIMDEDTQSPWQALTGSFRIMWKNFKAMFRLDLHFWWYYAAQVLLILIAWLDMLLPMVGVQLPIHADVSFFLFYGVYILCNLLLRWQFSARIQTTYAHFYLSKKQ